jgi:DNA-binding CsgD family transcriptional regulator
MQIIPPHIRPAFLDRDPLSHDETLTELLGRMITCAGFGLVLATSERRIVYANDAAKTLIRARSCLRCEHGCISATDFMTSRKLQSLVFAASRQTDEPVQGGPLVFRSEDGVALLVVHVVPLSPRFPILPPDIAYPVAGLFIVDCQGGTADRINAFADLFGLTPAEARVVSQLVSGGGVAKAATTLNIALSTAQTHLKHILEKTGTHRQAELVRVFYEITIPCYGRATAHSARDANRKAACERSHAAGKFVEPRCFHSFR